MLIIGVVRQCLDDIDNCFGPTAFERIVGADVAKLLVAIEGTLLLKSIGLDDVAARAF